MVANANVQKQNSDMYFLILLRSQRGPGLWYPEIFIDAITFVGDN